MKNSKLKMIFMSSVFLCSRNAGFAVLMFYMIILDDLGQF